MAEICYLCHEPLPPLAEEAGYVDGINHYAHDACLEERDGKQGVMTTLPGRPTRSWRAEDDDDAKGESESVRIREIVFSRIRRTGAETSDDVQQHAGEADPAVEIDSDASPDRRGYGRAL